MEKPLIFDYEAAQKRASKEEEKRAISLLQRYKKIGLRNDSFEGWIVDESMDSDDPEAWVRVYFPRLFELFNINIQPIDTTGLPEIVNLVSSKTDLFIIYVLNINNIETRIRRMTIDGNIQNKIESAIKDLASKY